MNACWKNLYPYLVRHFKGFEETPEAATNEPVQLMNGLDVSTEVIDEMIASHSEPMPNAGLIDIQVANTTSPEAKDDYNQCTLTVKKMNEAFTYSGVTRNERTR
jgi:hypothetical protein